ncbi:MAG: hypothetical protein LBH08_02080 [Puniceicoccales bacterium]|nr:hypothetical protein [Puniceicoccales bacterium]
MAIARKAYNQLGGRRTLQVTEAHVNGTKAVLEGDQGIAEDLALCIEALKDNLSNSEAQKNLDAVIDRIEKERIQNERRSEQNGQGELYGKPWEEREDIELLTKPFKNGRPRIGVEGRYVANWGQEEQGLGPKGRDIRACKIRMKQLNEVAPGGDCLRCIGEEMEERRGQLENEINICKSEIEGYKNKANMLRAPRVQPVSYLEQFAELHRQWLLEQIVELNRLIERCNTRIEENRRGLKVNELKSEIEAYKSEIKACKSEIKACEYDLKGLRIQIDQVDHEVVSSLKQIAELSRLIEKRNIEMEKISRKIKVMQENPSFCVKTFLQRPYSEGNRVSVIGHWRAELAAFNREKNEAYRAKKRSEAEA